MFRVDVEDVKVMHASEGDVDVEGMELMCAGGSCRNDLL